LIIGDLQFAGVNVLWGRVRIIAVARGVLPGSDQLEITPSNEIYRPGFQNK
jgi:hypothetical protein